MKEIFYNTQNNNEINDSLLPQGIKLLAKHADMVIVIGKHNAEMIIKGLIDDGMERENIKFAKSLNKGNALLNEILKEGDVVLFENDLPDNYN